MRPNWEYGDGWGGDSFTGWGSSWYSTLDGYLDARAEALSHAIGACEPGGGSGCGDVNNQSTSCSQGTISGWSRSATVTSP